MRKYPASEKIVFTLANCVAHEGTICVFIQLKVELLGEVILCSKSKNISRKKEMDKI